MVSLGMQSLGNKFQIQLLGDHAIQFNISTGLREGIDHDLLALTQFIKDKKIHGIKDFILAYETLTLIYDIHSFEINPYLFATQLLEEFITVSSTSKRTVIDNKLIEIPVCYDPSLGIDLQTAAISLNCSTETLIQTHSQKIYTVYCLGFLPGFAYMGDVPKGIQLPRHASPRPKVHAGSVGIAGKQTGIYPMASPGGWQIIGRTPIKIFNPNSTELALFKAGDQVKFNPISLALFHQLNTHQDVD
jgi:inhibitor of KinA